MSLSALNFCLPSTVCPQLFALNCLPSTVCPQLSQNVVDRLQADQLTALRHQCDSLQTEVAVRDAVSAKDDVSSKEERLLMLGDGARTMAKVDELERARTLLQVELEQAKKRCVCVCVCVCVCLCVCFVFYLP